MRRKKYRFYLPKIRQALIDKLKQDIKVLFMKKKNGHKVGKLKFKKFVRSVPLKQFGVAYSVTHKNHIKIQNINKKLRVRGLKKIPENVEFANAYLIQDHGDYYLRVMTYQNPVIETQTKGKAVGIDFGMKNQITLSNGIAIQYRIPITKKLRKLYQSLSRKENCSKNRYKARVRLQKEFYKLNCLKDDIKNKIVSCIKKNYSIVCYQDDNIKSWQRLWGRKILDTSIGEIKDILKERIPTSIAVSSHFPSTRQCFCEAKNDISLSDELLSATIVV